MVADAYHEAGHVVAAYHVGLTVAWVSLKTCELHLSWCDDLDSFLTAAMAGCVAGHISNPWTPATPGPGDRSMMHKFWPLLSDSLAGYVDLEPLHPARLALASDKASEILLANWPQVERLASRLEFCGHLTGAEVVKVLGTL